MVRADPPGPVASEARRHRLKPVPRGVESRMGAGTDAGGAAPARVDVRPECIPQKIESLLPGMPDARLPFVERQPQPLHPPPASDDHEVVRVVEAVQPLLVAFTDRFGQASGARLRWQSASAAGRVRAPRGGSYISSDQPQPVAPVKPALHSSLRRTRHFRPTTVQKRPVREAARAPAPYFTGNVREPTALVFSSRMIIRTCCTASVRG